MSFSVVHLPKHLLMAAVRAYRLLVSPWLGSSCRFEPSCSAYSLQALQTHGAVAGTWMTGHRLLRCGPWCEGGHDPVPARLPQPFIFISSLFHGIRRPPHGDSPPSSTPGPHP